MKTHLRTYNLLPTLDDCIKSCLSQLTSFALENSDEIESRKILTITSWGSTTSVGRIDLVLEINYVLYTSEISSIFSLLPGTIGEKSV